MQWQAPALFTSFCSYDCTFVLRLCVFFQCQAKSHPFILMSLVVAMADVGRPSQTWPHPGPTQPNSVRSPPGFEPSGAPGPGLGHWHCWPRLSCEELVLTLHARTLRLRLALGGSSGHGASASCRKCGCSAKATSSATALPLARALARDAGCRDYGRDPTPPPHQSSRPRTN